MLTLPLQGDKLQKSCESKVNIRSGSGALRWSSLKESRGNDAGAAITAYYISARCDSSLQVLFLLSLKTIKATPEALCCALQGSFCEQYHAEQHLWIVWMPLNAAWICETSNPKPAIYPHLSRNERLHTQ